MFKLNRYLLPAATAILLTCAGCAGGDEPAGDVIDDAAGDNVAAEDAATDDTARDATEPAPIDLEKTPGIYLAGEWTDAWDTAHFITSATWLQKSSYGDSVFHIVSWDNNTGFAVAQNDAANGFSPNLYSRFDWTVKDGTVYYCNSKYDAATAAEAAAATPGDATDPTSGGCGGFAWSSLTPVDHIGLRGLYADDAGNSYSLSDTAWTRESGDQTDTFTISSFDNAEGVAIAQNAATNATNPGKWSRFDWVVKYGVIYVCQAADNAETAEAAQAVYPPDDDKPATAGCAGDAPWTVLTATGSAMDKIVDAPGDTGEGTGNAANAVNGVRGAGRDAGGSDVFSLGFDYDANGYIVLSFDGYAVTDGPGADLVVFENAFSYGEGGGLFMDLAVVLLSRDGETWVPYPFDYVADDENAYSKKPSDWTGFAGATPTYLNVDTNPVDPFNQALAGGDQFDISALPSDDPDAVAIRQYGFTYMKLIPAPLVLNPDTGAFFVRDDMSNGFDLDGVYARYLTAR